MWWLILLFACLLSYTHAHTQTLLCVRWRMSTAATLPATTTTFVIWLRCSVPTWEMKWCCSPQMVLVWVISSVAPYRGCMPLWTLDQVQIEVRGWISVGCWCKCGQDELQLLIVLIIVMDHSLFQRGYLKKKWADFEYFTWGLIWKVDKHYLFVVFTLLLYLDPLFRLYVTLTLCLWQGCVCVCFHD